MEVVQNAGFNAVIMALKGKQLKTLQSTCCAICQGSTQSTILYPTLSLCGATPAM